MLLTMVRRSLRRQVRRRGLIAATVALATSVSVAMLGVVFDVGDKLSAELTAYGSNIVVQPKADAIISDLYQTGDAPDVTSSLDEADVPRIKTIFWAYNIVDFTPTFSQHVSVTSGDGTAADPATTTARAVGTWFDKQLDLATGEQTVAGVSTMRPWWTLNGTWPVDGAAQAVVGQNLAHALGLSTGATMTIGSGNEARTVEVVGTYVSGDDDDDAAYVSLDVLQAVVGQPGRIGSIEVKALTTPENDLSRKAARNPAALTRSEWEIWYCTAYPSSIAYQIEEVVPGAVAKQVRQVAAVEGSVLEKTQALMILMTVLSLVAAALAIASLTAASLVERTSELALLKALGATTTSINRLILLETGAVGLLGAVAGALIGSGLAQLVGYLVFGSLVAMRPMVYVLVAILIGVVLLAATAQSMRSILRLEPATALRRR